jgi:23S rRNA (guanosine2251-2'-O)-methyltransferase
MEKKSISYLGVNSRSFSKPPKNSVIRLVLDNVRSAHNVGSLFRTADALGIIGIDLCGITAIPPHKEIAKAALGAENVVAFRHFPNTPDAILALKEEGFKIVVIEQVHQSISLTHWTALQEPIAVVVGHEMDGVGEQWIKEADFVVEIPQFGMKHSLNVSSAGAIALWEIVRQRSVNELG